MRCINIPLGATGQINKLTADYLDAKEELSGLYRWDLSMKAAAGIIEERKKYPVNRALLVQGLQEQYRQLGEIPEAVAGNIQKLENDNIFTITTGHQLNIFSGPAFFIYKIISVIKYTEQLRAACSEYDFVPVYWMASEDHDLAEIDHFQFWNKEYKWDTTQGGAVGRMNTEGLAQMAAEIAAFLDGRNNAAELTALLQQAYSQPTLSLATQFLVNALFKDYGLVIIDADRGEWKQLFTGVLAADIFENVPYQRVSETIGQLAKEYKLPVNPREINVFYLSPGNRQRIIKNGDRFEAGDISWTAEELQSELQEQPQNFSPNVVLRPMYQEVLLPNLAYIGGNNEIAYWLELKAAFDVLGVFFPQLVVRDSVLWLGKKPAKELEGMKLEPADMLKSWEDLKFYFYNQNELLHPAEQSVDDLLTQYEALRQHLQGLPSDLVAAVVKQANLHVKELKKWKADIHKRQMEAQDKNIQKLEKLYSAVFPNDDFQERQENFIPYYLQYGPALFDILKENFDPLAGQLHILIEE
jgi:bacillithiol biosynthesis cysteine-adding enzyme BshC